LRKGRGVVIANPGFKQIAENIQCVCLGCAGLQEMEEGRVNLGPFGAKVEVGNKKGVQRGSRAVNVQQPPRFT